MIPPPPAILQLYDPLVVSLAQDHPVKSEVLAAAITYRESILDVLAQEIEALKHAHARCLRQEAG